MNFLRPGWGLCRQMCQNPQPHLAPKVETVTLLLRFLTHTDTHTRVHPPSLILPQNIKRTLCRHLGEVWVWVLRLHTSLSFGITTEITAFSFAWKEGRDGGSGGGGVVVCQGVWETVELHAGKGTREKTDKQWCYLPTQITPVCPHPVIKVHGYKTQLTVAENNSER